jgi:hypothetical protein
MLWNNTKLLWTGCLCPLHEVDVTQKVGSGEQHTHDILHVANSCR